MTEAPESNPTPESTPEPQADPTQEKWTGELLGRALLARYVEDALNPGGEKESPDALRARARQILKTLPPENTVEFNKYSSIIPVTIALRYTADAAEAKMTLAVERLDTLVNTAITAEKFYAYLSRLPKYLTGKDVVEAQKAGREQYFTLDGKDIMQSPYDLIITAVEYYLDLLEKEPGKANPLAAVKELYEQEQVNSRLILNTWHSVHGYGFYTRKDGRKSEVMTRAEYDELVAAETEADLTEVIKNCLGKGDYLTFERELKEDAESIQSTTWQDVTGQPKELTKWQAVKDLDLIYKAQDSVKDLQREFSTLVEAVGAQLQADYDINILTIPVEDWKKPYVSRRQLYRLGFCNCKKTADNYYRRAYKNGVAIAQDNWDTKANLYAELDLETYKEQTLEAYTRGYPFYGTKRKNITENKARLLGYHSLLRAYNYILVRIAELHGVPEFKQLQEDTRNVLGKVQALNYHIELLHETIRALPPGELRREKLKMLRVFFLFPGLDKLEIPLANRRKADKLIKNFTAFRDVDKLIRLLTGVHENAEGGSYGAGQPE